MAKRLPHDPGFTLIEVLFALSMLVLFLASVSTIAATALRAVSRARVMTIAALLASQKIEMLRAQAAVAPLTPSSSQALQQDLPCCVDRLDSAGRVVSAGAAGAAVYVRRWSIQPLSAPAPPGQWSVTALVMPAFASPSSPQAVTLTSVVGGPA
jgi:prepilin-type N-terminal cleavage/methylation domain-containing protein